MIPVFKLLLVCFTLCVEWTWFAPVFRTFVALKLKCSVSMFFQNSRIPRFWVCDETLWSSKKSLESSESVLEFRNVFGTEFWIDIDIHFFMMINNSP